MVVSGCGRPPVHTLRPRGAGLPSCPARGLVPCRPPLPGSPSSAEDLAYDEELEEGYLYEESPTYEGEDLVDDGGPVDHDLTDNSDLVDGDPTDDDLIDSDPVDGDDSDLADDYDVQ